MTLDQDYISEITVKDSGSCESSLSDFSNLKKWDVQMI